MPTNIAYLSLYRCTTYNDPTMCMNVFFLFLFLFSVGKFIASILGTKKAYCSHALFL